MRWGVKFRLFRSKAFWFGVPGLVGLLWGWWVSMGHDSYAGFGGYPPWGIGQIRGEVYPCWGSAGWPEWREFYVGHVQISGEQVSEVKLSLSSWPDRDPTLHCVFIPYYWLVLGYVVGWAGLVIWRKRTFEKRPVD